MAAIAPQLPYLLGSGPRMNPLTLGAALTAPAVWSLRHNRSASVRAWSAPQIPGKMHGPLYARAGGDGDTAMVLLHGLVSTGDVFGSAFESLADHYRLVVPDLLGFGRSIDHSRDSFSAEAHLDALDELADSAGLFDRRWTLGAHSMGSALALRWAARHHDRVDCVVCWGAPIYRSPAAARAHISGSAMTRLFVVDPKWAERACAISCHHRTAVGWLTAAGEPQLPVPIARAVSQHTWPAYRDAMRGLVIDTDWSGLGRQLDDNKIGAELVWGSNDTVGDPDYAGTIIGPQSPVTLIANADHHIPMTHPQICCNQLTSRSPA